MNRALTPRTWTIEANMLQIEVLTSALLAEYGRALVATETLDYAWPEEAEERVTLLEDMIVEIEVQRAGVLASWTAADAR